VVPNTSPATVPEVALAPALPVRPPGLLVMV